MNNLIGLLGDVHGRSGVVASMLKRFKKQGVSTIIQVGDFGFWPGKAGILFIKDVSKALLDNNQNMIVIPGNHEDYRQINELSEDEDGWLTVTPQIKVAPRGFRWTYEGVSFVALGGAPSVDRAWRIANQRQAIYPFWWPEEDITAEDIEKTVSGGYADVMIAHDAPWGVPQIEERIKDNPLGFEDEDLEYALEGRLKMLAAINGVSPKIFVHGHYHFPVDDSILTGDGQETRIFGLNADGRYGTCAILDVSDLSVSIVG